VVGETQARPEEIGQQVACEPVRRYEGRDPAELLPPSLPDTPVTFEPNKDYVRQALAGHPVADLRPQHVS
jgi:hypothetical protein